MLVHYGCLFVMQNARTYISTLMGWLRETLFTDGCKADVGLLVRVGCDVHFTFWGVRHGGIRQWYDGRIFTAATQHSSDVDYGMLCAHRRWVLHEQD